MKKITITISTRLETALRILATISILSIAWVFTGCGIFYICASWNLSKFACFIIAVFGVAFFIVMLYATVKMILIDYFEKLDKDTNENEN